MKHVKIKTQLCQCHFIVISRMGAVLKASMDCFIIGIVLWKHAPLYACA